MIIPVDVLARLQEYSNMEWRSVMRSESISPEDKYYFIANKLRDSLDIDDTDKVYLYYSYLLRLPCIDAPPFIASLRKEIKEYVLKFASTK